MFYRVTYPARKTRSGLTLIVTRWYSGRVDAFIGVVQADAPIEGVVFNWLSNEELQLLLKEF